MQKYYLSFLLGLISGLVYAPYFLVFLWLTLPILLYKLDNEQKSYNVFYLSYLYGFGHFVTSLYWISNALLIYKGFLWLIPFCILGIPFLLGIFIAAPIYLSYFFNNSIFFTFIFSFFWTLFEYIRSFIFTGFPWNLAGYSLFFSDILVQSIYLIGIYGLSFFVIYFFSNFFYIFLGKQKVFLIHFIFSLIIILLGTFYGLGRLNNNPTKFLDNKVRIVQAALPQYMKWSEEIFKANLDSYIELSQSDNNFNPEIIIWPESAITYHINNDEVRKYIADYILNKNIYLISGTIYYTDKLYNSFVILDHLANIKGLYHKKHLVPFGEYIPFNSILPIKKITPGAINYSEGKTSNILTIGNLKIRPLICYEAIFPYEINVTSKDVDLLINITNDSWYGNSMGPYQHFQMSRARAIETGLPMLRVASNGISAIIDPLGRVVKSSQINEVAILDGYIPKKLTQND